MSDSSFKNDLFDAVLKEAVSQLKEEELQKSEKFFEEHKMEDYVPSRRFTRRIKRAYRMHCIKRSLNSRALKRVASVLLTVGVVSGSFIFLAEANDISLYETIFLREERYTSIETYKQILTEDHEDSLDYFYFPKYIPVGFEVVDVILDKEIQYISFEKGAEYFCISQWINSTTVKTRIDTENAEMEKIIINDSEGFYTEEKDKQSIYLTMGNVSINIYGNIGKKELFIMAENLELLQK